MVGVRSGDKGRGKRRRGARQLRAGRGPDRQGHRARRGHARATSPAPAIRHFGLGSEDPQQWELGVKEVWEVEKPLDRVIHTMGWPLKFAAKYREFGGSFIYPMGEDTRSRSGFVVGLDYRDATLLRARRCSSS